MIMIIWLDLAAAKYILRIHSNISNVLLIVKFNMMLSAKKGIVSAKILREWSLGLDLTGVPNINIWKSL